MDTTIKVPGDLAATASATADRLRPDYPRSRLSTASVLRAYAASALGTRAGLSPLERLLADRLDADDEQEASL